MKRTSQQHNPSSRRGAIIVLVAVALVIFMVSLVFCIDVAYMQLTRTELRGAVDASARAGAEALSRLQDVDAARVAAKSVAESNLVAGEPFTLPDSDIVFGRVGISHGGVSTFAPNQNPPNAIRILSGRTSGRPDGNVGLYFGGFIGRGNYEPLQSAVAAQLDRDIALVLDRSSSMEEDDKFEDLQTAVSVFFSEINNTPQTELVSITVYDANADKVIDLTADTSAANAAFASVDTGSGTAIGRGLEMGIDSLMNDAGRRPFAEATVVLVTDGQHNTGISPEDALDAAPTTFVLHTITFGSDADQDRMEDLATMRNGKHFHAPDGSTLSAIFQEIGVTIPIVLTN